MTRKELEAEILKVRNKCHFMGRLISSILRKHGGSVSINFEDFDKPIMVVTVTKNNETKTLKIEAKEVNNE